MAPVYAPGRTRGTGTLGVYRRLQEKAGERRILRTELGGTGESEERRTLLHIAHITDTHVADASSPGRFEFAQRLYEIEEMRSLLPTYRPQEMLSLHVLEAMIRAVNEIETGQFTGEPLQAALFTGDLIDNAQRNELQRFLAVVTGGSVRPAGQAGYEGVAAPGWGDDAYWRPGAGSDEYKRQWGFPDYPDLLDDLARPFAAQGLRHPWLACRGNHDLLAHGTAIGGEVYEAVLLGDRKAATLPSDFVTSPTSEQFELFLRSPELFLRGDARPISPDPERRIVPPGEFLAALRGAAGNLPAGGSSQPAYHVHDGFEDVRLILLDTINRAGHWDGSIGARQLAWLEERLSEVHSRYWDEAGNERHTDNEARLVAIAAHHPLGTMTNLRHRDVPDEWTDEPRLGGGALAALLHRFPNVVLYLNGHVHRNRILPHPDPAGRAPGFWEVTTSSLVDWPCEARQIEVTANGDGTLSILTTMLPSAAPADPGEAEGVLRLAAIHRELALNDPHAGWRTDRAGTSGDRTTELRLPAPAFIQRHRNVNIAVTSGR
jgi:metallophosphoesterase (TIGR03767 family)